jgi:hypothetical protein
MMTGTWDLTDLLTLAFSCRALQQDATSERSEQGAILEGPVKSNARLDGGRPGGYGTNVLANGDVLRKRPNESSNCEHCVCNS